MSGRLAVLLKGYPRLSETFIAQELRGLERAGLTLDIFAMRQPHDTRTHPIHAEIEAPVAYLPEYLHWDIPRVLRSLGRVRTLPGFTHAASAFRRDIVSSPLMARDRCRRFGQAAVLAAELPGNTRAIYAHFIHTPSSVARYASLMTGLPWMCSAHAKDIWTTPDAELSTKLASADWAVTCTSVGHRRLAGLAPSPERVRLVYHGLDLARFPPRTRIRGTRNGSDPSDPVRILSVGRAVPKKGLDTLVEALSRLPHDLQWRFTHIGGGTEAKMLRRLAESRGIAARCEWKGAQDQPTVLDAYGQADIFALPCRVTASGDRDGLPNVLMEAQSQALACVSTPVGAVGELIRDGETGALVPPDDPAALADTLGVLIGDPALRTRYGTAGERRVRSEFDARATLPTLLGLMGVASAERAKDAIAP